MKVPFNLSEVIDDYIDKGNEIIVDLLPLVHITNGETLREHFMSEFSLKPVNKCVYHNNEKLLFFFYGKGSYIPTEHQLAGFDDETEPIGFIYFPKIFESINIHRLICFDSGAYINGKFSRKGKKKTTNLLKSFIKEHPKIIHIKAAVQAIYSDNINYFKNKIKPYYSKKDTKVSKCLNTIYELAAKKKTIKTEFGQQAFTFEIQVIHEIDDLPDAIVIPSEFFTSEDTIDTLKETFNKSKFIEYEYNTDHGTQINDAYSYMKKEINSFIYNNFVTK